MVCHKEQQQQVAEKLLLGEEEEEDALSTIEIKELLIMWQEVQTFIESHHPNKAVSGYCKKLFNDNARSHFRVIVKASLIT